MSDSSKSQGNLQLYKPLLQFSIWLPTSEALEHHGEHGILQRAKRSNFSQPKAEAFLTSIFKNEIDELNQLLRRPQT